MYSAILTPIPSKPNPDPFCAHRPGHHCERERGCNSRFEVPLLLLFTPSPIFLHLLSIVYFGTHTILPLNFTSLLTGRITTP